MVLDLKADCGVVRYLAEIADTRILATDDLINRRPAVSADGRSVIFEQAVVPLDGTNEWQLQDLDVPAGVLSALGSRIDISAIGWDGNVVAATARPPCAQLSRDGRFAYSVHAPANLDDDNLSRLRRVDRFSGDACSLPKTAWDIGGKYPGEVPLWMGDSASIAGPDVAGTSTVIGLVRTSPSTSVVKSTLTDEMGLGVCGVTNVHTLASGTGGDDGNTSNFTINPTLSQAGTRAAWATAMTYDTVPFLPSVDVWTWWAECPTPQPGNTVLRESVNGAVQELALQADVPLAIDGGTCSVLVLDGSEASPRIVTDALAF